MNVLYLTYDGLTDPLGQSQIIPYMQGMASLGYSITIISCEKTDRLEKDGSVIQSLLQQFGIQWQPVLYSNVIPVVSQLTTLHRLYKAAKKLLQQKNYSIIHCRSTLPAMVGYRLKKQFSIPLIFDMRGFWAEERVEGNIWPQNKILYRSIYKYILKQEKMLLAESDHIISLTNAGKQIMLNQQVKKPISVIPCCADFQHFNPETISANASLELRRKLSIPDDAFVLIYTGSIGTWYLLDEMMQFFKEFVSAHENSFFLLITREKHELINTAAQKAKAPLSKIKMASAGRNEMPLYLSLANASIYFIKPGFSKQASSPVKQGEALSMGIPVITNSGIGDSDDIIFTNNFGWVLQLNSDYGKAIQEIKSTPTDRGEIRRKSHEILSLDSGIEKYLKVYKSVTSQ